MNVKQNIPADRSWEKIIRKYSNPVLRRSIWQIVNTFLPYAVLIFLMYLSLNLSYWITLALAIPASGFLIRIFIIFHDCGHGSFFRKQRANTILGSICGFLSFTPYKSWHHHHKIHHATAVNLDKRGIGDIWTLTREEYESASGRSRFIYRSFRNPFVMFTIGPLYLLLIQNRFTNKQMTKENKQNVYLTNLVVLVMSLSMILLMGLKGFLLIQLPVLFLSHSIGIWLFLIQHNFEDINWERNDEWDYKSAALEGSSFLKLPAVFQWFSGNIGYHHVHHLSPRIPNYNLERCHNENEIFSAVKPIYFFSTFRFLKLHLWDEKNQKMISFSALRQPVYA